MDQRPSVWSFALAFRKYWFAAMSGGFSVPFAFAAALADNKFTQGVLLAPAFGGAWFAAYEIWKIERGKVIELQAISSSAAVFVDLMPLTRLGEKIGRYRIEMEADSHARRFDEKVWQAKFDEFQDEIASKIEQFASRAEAIAYRHRGNIQRPMNTNMVAI